MSDFEIHWNRVTGRAALPFEDDGRAVFALWPAPVNLDACFEAAGFTQFADHDDEWDQRADAMLERLVHLLSAHGAPHLVSEPLREPVPWLARPFRKGRPLPLMEQLLEPIHWDSLPRCRIEFGDSGYELIAGDGHYIAWLIAPAAEKARVPLLVAKVAGQWPLYQTTLHWEHLLVERAP